MTMHRSARVKRFVVVATLLFATSVATIPSADSAQKHRWGLAQSPSTSYLYVTNTGHQVCGAHAPLWMQELGTSGITRMRARYELRGYYDAGLPGLAYQYTPWFYSASFPDDYRSFWTVRGLHLHPRQLRFYAGGRYSLRTKMVWERPSFWHRDIVRAVTLGAVGCENRHVDLGS